MIKKLCISFFIGLSITSYVMLHDPWVKKLAGSAFEQAFSRALDCRMTCEVDEISLYPLGLTLKNVTVDPCKGTAWQWTAQAYSTHISWWQLVCYGTLDMKVALDTVAMHSDVADGEVAIAKHVDKMFNGPSMAINTCVDAVACSGITCVLHDKTTTLRSTLAFDLAAKRIDGMMRSSIHVHDGSCTFQGQCLVADLSGTLYADTQSAKSNNDMVVHCNCSLELPLLPASARTCYFSGSWEKEHGTFVFKNNDRSLVADPIVMSMTTLQAAASLQLEQIVHALIPKGFIRPLSGDCALDVHVDMSGNTPRMHAQAALENVRYGGMNIGSCVTCSATNTHGSWQGDVTILPDTEHQLVTSWTIDHTDAGDTLSIASLNTARLPIADTWLVEADKCMTSVTRTVSGTVHASYSCAARNAQTQELATTTGNFIYDDAAWALHGVFNDRAYEIKGTTAPRVRLTSCSYTNNHGSPVVMIRAHEDDASTYDGFVQIPFAQNVVRQFTGYDVQGDGTFVARVSLADNTCHAHFSLDHGTIRLPQTYNFIDSFSVDADIDFAKRLFTLRNGVCTLHKGALTCTRGRLMFDPLDGIVFAHIPVLFDSCLLNVEQDLFAIVSGSVLLEKRPASMALLRGDLIIERCQLKGNLFSQTSHKQLVQLPALPFQATQHDVRCDIHIQTKSPIRVHTAFLRANAQMNLAIKNTISAPDVTGSISLIDGALLFPYKPLHIERGQITFVSKQLFDPLIELVAKNRVKKHSISLQVTGSLLNHHILLGATPTLTEEQIIALLLIGSQEDSLNIVMPALIMQNMKFLLFGDEQSPHKLDRIFKKLFKPLAYVNVIPSFSDQSGRGGLRGAIEIDVNERWHALIQKNFSLSEDTRFEVEYLVSDDISIRGVRDERRDVGAEVEMRWKF